MELYLIFISVVILILALVGLLVILNEFKRNNLNTIKEIESVSNMQYKEINEFKTLINSEINEIQTKISNDMLYMNNHINNSINSLNNMTSNRLNQIENSVNSSLFKSYDKTEKLMISVSEKMTTINETQNSIKEISKDITSLGNILNDKKTRGIFGEIELYSILENVFGTN
ncbi:MAG: DNA recombination protein RmuC, partial [Erysipelotrichaceae bacterium]